MVLYRSVNMAASLLAPDPDLWVVSCYYNAHEDHNRHRNCLVFAREMKRQGVPVLMVELCKDETVSGLPHDLFQQYIRVNHSDELWSKEALINLGVKQLPVTCTKVCWIDADIVFLDDHWATRCSRLLDKYKVVQPFDTYAFLNNTDSLQPRKNQHPDKYNHGFAYHFTKHGLPRSFTKAHPGYAWAAQRTTFEHMGGLYTKAVLGLADVMMAYGFTATSLADVRTTWQLPDIQTFMGSWNMRIVNDCTAWQQRAMHHVHGNVGAPNANVKIHHLYHGSSKQRKYDLVGKILSKYDPQLHVTINNDGLLHWTAGAPASLKKEVSLYFHDRKKNSINVR